jgi:hypothetical protein
LKKGREKVRNGTVSISLAIVPGLSVGLIGCGSEEVPEYNLTISSTEGGSVTTSGGGTSIYAAGTVVNLTATPDAGYLFVGWTGNWSAIADVYSAETTTTTKSDYTITANYYSILLAANDEVHLVKLASVAYFVDHGVWPISTASDNFTTYVSGTLKAGYIFDSNDGWLLSATNSTWGDAITFEGGMPGPTGHHGQWVRVE